MEKNVSWHTARLVNERNKGQFNDEPSLTVRGLAEPMNVILERFQRGHTVLGKEPFYDSDVNPDFEKEEPFRPSDFDYSDLDIARDKAARAQVLLDEEKKKAAAAKKLLDDEKLADEVIARRVKKEVVKEGDVLPPENIVK